jgi:hypothetical protein
MLYAKGTTTTTEDTMSDYNPYALRDALQARREHEADLFSQWCEANDADPNDPETTERFDAVMAEEDDSRY